MKKMLKNSKGFTLVELLAVIVVLAVIILIAMPAVMSSMEKARKNALKTEAAEIIKIAQTAFADDSLQEGIKEACYSIKYLAANGYLDKNDDKYSGSVKISIDPATSKATYTIWISNGMYGIIGKLASDVNKADSVNEDTAASNKCDGTITNVKKVNGEPDMGVATSQTKN